MMTHNCEESHCKEEALPERCPHYRLQDQPEYSHHPLDVTKWDLRLALAKQATEVLSNANS